jgi:hypothetical protein
MSLLSRTKRDSHLETLSRLPLCLAHRSHQDRELRIEAQSCLFTMGPYVGGLV